MRSLTFLPLLLHLPQEDPWPGLERLAPLLDQQGIQGEFDALGQRIRTLSANSRAEKISTFFGLTQADPLETPRNAIELSDALFDAARKPEPDGLLRSALEACSGVELGPTPAYRELFPRNATFLERMDTVSSLLQAAASEVERALSGVAPEDRASLVDGLGALLDELRTNVYLLGDEEHARTWSLLDGVDLSAMVSAAALLSPLTDRRMGPELRDAYRVERPERPGRMEGVEGRLLYARETDLGWVLVGSAGDNSYDLPVAFLFDLGGEDRYEATTTASSLDRPVNFVLDLEGDDLYEASDLPGQACGLFGVSVLLDVEGADRYQGSQFQQGCGVAGVGLLIDRSGDDIYSADAYAQGAGCYGFGLLVDVAGDDRMTSHLYSQGFAGPASFGALVDVEGEDTRRCRGSYPSTYGTAGEFNAFSQGCGIGLRTLDPLTRKAAGGVGVLVDGGGDDVSEVGEFGYGCGYFFGVGVARDLGGHDQVRASRYGIATGAHFGVGVVLDDEGNDRWVCPYTAAVAGNWDLTYSFFIDRSGDDIYEASGISLGSSTITSLAVFMDCAGVDEYRTGGAHCFGNAGHPQDLGRDAVSVSMFIDLGGARDVYPTTGLVPGPTNDLVAARRRSDSDNGREGETGVGVFLDE